jgi:hypothetical protein
MLYNFHDSPTDLFERMRLNVALNEELGIRIFSFPMRYQPTDLPDRSFVGEKWNRYYLRSMQIILQATHGIVSGSPDFFKRAFGNTFEEYEQILLRPHPFIFNREWYENLAGRAQFQAYHDDFAKLSASQRSSLLEILATRHPHEYRAFARGVKDLQLRNVLHHYFHPRKEQEMKIWRKVSKLRAAQEHREPTMADDERVEDAGLYDEPEGSSHNSPVMELA